MRLSISFGFGVGEDREGLSIPRETLHSALKVIKKHAAQVFGGYTLYAAQGGWINGGGRLVEEDSMTLLVYAGSDDPIENDKVSSQIEELRSLIKTQLNQEAVAVATANVSITIQ